MIVMKIDLILLLVYAKICMYSKTIVWSVKRRWYKDLKEEISTYLINNIISI